MLMVTAGAKRGAAMAAKPTAFGFVMLMVTTGAKRGATMAAKPTALRPW